MNYGQSLKIIIINVIRIILKLLPAKLSQDRVINFTSGSDIMAEYQNVLSFVSITFIFMIHKSTFSVLLKTSLRLAIECCNGETSAPKVAP